MTLGLQSWFWEKRKKKGRKKGADGGKGSSGEKRNASALSRREIQKTGTPDGQGERREGGGGGDFATGRSEKRKKKKPTPYGKNLQRGGSFLLASVYDGKGKGKDRN